MAERFVDAVGRAKSYVSKLAAQKNNYTENIDTSKIWQLDNTYIVSPIDSGIVIIDQMLAHQRILYENALGFLASPTKSTSFSQTLLFPVELKLLPIEYSNLLDALPYLNKIGFNLKKNENNSIILEAIPSDMLRGNEAEVISKILNSLISLGKEESSKEKVVALSFSKYACIKHGDILNENEMIEIVNRLFGTKKPFVCPSGKSSIVQIPINEIISRFLKN
jgi:DNA mismatch repair protein MutL